MSGNKLTLPNREHARQILERRVTPRPPSVRPPDARPPAGARPPQPGFKGKPSHRPRPRVIEAPPDQPWWAVRRIGNDVFHGPMVRHPSKEFAIAEAERLARKHLGVRFCVLEVVASYVAEQPA